MTVSIRGEPSDTGRIDALPRDELFRAFFGPNPDKFEGTLHRMREQNPALTGLVPSWCWPAFIITVPWLFYRKMYVWGVGIVAMLTAFELMMGESIAGRTAVFAVTAINAKSLYIHHANRRLKRLCAVQAEEAALLRQATEQGGVSLIAAVIGTVLMIAGLLLVALVFD
jgi:hypothetical protein